MIYKNLIDTSYQEFKSMNDGYNKTDFVLALFDIYLYETGENADQFAFDMMEVIAEITLGNTHEFHEKTPLIYFHVLNYTQIANKVEWGTSIRGAHWRGEIVLDTCLLFDHKGNQIRKKTFNRRQFKEFTMDLYKFYFDSRDDE